MSDPVNEARLSWRLWAAAAVVALALHAGGAALALSHLGADDFDNELGAPAIEIGLEMMAPEASPSELPPGPEADATAASAAVPEQKAEVRDTDLPKDTPTETEEPDRAVTTNNTKKPVEDEAKVAIQTEAAQESVASEATATPSLEAVKRGPNSVAPVKGTGESTRRIRATWQKELVAHFDRHKRYPAERSQKAAEILVSFVLDRLGHVLSVNLVKGSGDTAFDEAAIAMVRRSDPVPQPPAVIADEGLTFTLPVVFRVKSKG